MVAGAVGPLLVIVGPTASGKSALAVELAERFSGEIICADSRTVYRGMDIGTAKPSVADRARVPHHLLDVVAPNESFTAARFKTLAQQCIDDIHTRGRLPILVGGTGLYVDAVIYDFQFLPPAPTELRQQLAAMSVEDLQTELRRKAIDLPHNSCNRRHLIRALETNGATAEQRPLRPHTILIGIDPGKEVLDNRIHERVQAMFANGFLAEAQTLGEAYGWNAEALQTPGYKAARAYLDGDKTADEAMALFAQNDRQYAKRQRTWFRRNKSIHWFTNSGETQNIVDFVTTSLNKE